MTQRADIAEFAAKRFASSRSAMIAKLGHSDAVPLLKNKIPSDGTEPGAEIASVCSVL